MNKLQSVRAEAIYRMELEQCVRKVWRQLRLLSDLEKPGIEVLTKADVQLWEAVTIHPGVQKVLEEHKP